MAWWSWCIEMKVSSHSESKNNKKKNLPGNHSKKAVPYPFVIAGLTRNPLTKQSTVKTATPFFKKGNPVRHCGLDLGDCGSMPAMTAAPNTKLVGICESTR